MKVELGAISSTWSSFAPVNAEIATIASPPGLFSTTTGLPHFCDSLSAISRAPMSTPEPGPSGTMKRALRCGQAGVVARRRGKQPGPQIAERGKRKRCRQF